MNVEALVLVVVMAAARGQILGQFDDGGRRHCCCLSSSAHWNGEHLPSHPYLSLFKFCYTCASFVILGHHRSYLTHLKWIIEAFTLQYIALHCTKRLNYCTPRRTHISCLPVKFYLCLVHTFCSSTSRLNITESLWLAHPSLSLYILLHVCIFCVHTF